MKSQNCSTSECGSNIQSRELNINNMKLLSPPNKDMLNTIEMLSNAEAPEKPRDITIFTDKGLLVKV